MNNDTKAEYNLRERSKEYMGGRIMLGGGGALGGTEARRRGS